VRHSIERVEPAATRKSIAIGLEASGAHVVPGDAMRLGQVLDNLLSNAVKFTPDHGSVTVRLERANGVCTVEVEDTGHGIPKDERGRVFERFFRSRDAVARSIPGTGLGLVVSRRIAEAHGGGLELVEGNGNGTTFRLLLPVGSPAAEAQVASAQRR
jgi:signal transduction histidine kinase